MVQAMQSGVEWVWLWEEVSLDIKALSEYSGQGVCKIMSLQTEKAKEYQWELRTWAKSRNWGEFLIQGELAPFIPYQTVFKRLDAMYFD